MDLTKEVYVSLDVEADGEFPFINSMWSLGAAAIAFQHGHWHTPRPFSANLIDFPGAKPNPRTMNEFWDKQPVAYMAARSGARAPVVVMYDFAAWLREIQCMWPERRLIAVASPAGYDFPFVRGYMLHFLGTDAPFGHRCDDTRARASSILKIPYSEAGKDSYPSRWTRDKFPHTHVASEDAVEQAWLYARILEDLVV